MPFDDIRELLAGLAPADERANEVAKNRNASLEEMFGSLGKMGEQLEWMASWSGKSPIISRPLVALFAGTHRICETVSVSGEETLNTITRLSAGGSPANQVCSANDIGLKVFDLALQYPVENITSSEALDEKGAAATIGFGMEAIAGGVDVLGLSAFGKGGQIASSIILQMLGAPSALNILDVFGFAGSDETSNAVEKIVELHSGIENQPLEILRRLGGREHSALAGAILAARTNHIPVLVSGLTSLSVIAVLEAQQKGSCDHCMFVGKTPTKDMLPQLLNELQLMLPEIGSMDEGSSVANAIGVLRSAAAMHTNSVLEA